MIVFETRRNIIKYEWVYDDKQNYICVYVAILGLTVC